MQRIAIKKCGRTVGHVPFNLVPIVSAFLKIASNNGLVEVTRNTVNRGASYGYEIPCDAEYHFYGAKLYTERLKIIVDKQRSDGLLLCTSLAVCMSIIML